MQQLEGAEHLLGVKITPRFHHVIEEANLILRFAEPLRTAADSTVVIRLHHDSDYRRATLGKFRVALSSATYSWADSLPGNGLPTPLRSALELTEDKRTPEQVKLIRDFFEYSSVDLFPAKLTLSKMEASLSLLQGAVAQVMVTESMEPRETRLLPRGDWMNAIC